MAQVFGIEVPHPRQPQPAPQSPVRYLVLIDSAATGGRLARLLLQSREQVAELDAGAPEVRMMTRELAAERGAGGTEWDAALGGHSRTERATAEIYTLDL